MMGHGMWTAAADSISVRCVDGLKRTGKLKESRNTRWAFKRRAALNCACMHPY